MEAQDMASAELAEWRKKESEKEIEAIKKSELDKLAEAKKKQLIDKGVDDAVKVAEELRPLDISDIIDTNAPVTEKNEVSTDSDKGSRTKDKSGSHSHSKKDRSKEPSSKYSEREKEKHDKDRRRSERHKSDKNRESLKEKEKETDRPRRSTREKEKESSKVKHSVSSDSKSRDKKYSHKHSKEKDSEKGKSSSTSKIQGKVNKSPPDSECKKSDESEGNTPTEASTSSDATLSSQMDVSETSKGEARHSTDSEPELPSSTIKTPDFTEESSSTKKGIDSKHLFQTRVVMPELGGFNASAHAVSHFTTEGIIFPEEPVPIVGRIGPETVWDYINKMKKTKEVIVLRLSPATPADSEGYMTFFSYFSSRGRLGVMGGITHPLKDVYLVPLDKHSPVNRALLPFRGPGLPQERTHCLLAVITRHIQGDIPASVPLKRKSSTAEQMAAKKKVKFGPEQKPATTKPSTRSSVSGALEPPKLIKMPAKAEKKNKDDDDAPYTPWEEEDEKDDLSSTSKPIDDPLLELKPPLLIPEVPAPKQTVDVQKELQELEAKIAKERQDIEKITGALAGRQSMSGIPGLDGEFPEGEDPSEETQGDVPFFLRGPSSTESQVKDSIKGVISTSEVLPSQISIPIDDTPDSTDSSNDVIIEDKPSEEADEKKEESDSLDTKAEDSEEAYSPSAMQFSDDDSQVIEQMPDITAQKQTEDKVIKDDHEPFPPGLEVQTNSSIPSEPQQDDIKIVLKKPTFASTMAPLVTQGLPSSLISSSDSLKSTEVVDLVDDIEPPPPGEVLPVAPTKQPALATKPDPVFEKIEPVFTKPTTTSGIVSIGSHAKMKININLTTKQLPSHEAPQPNESPKVSKPLPDISAVTNKPASTPTASVNNQRLAPPPPATATAGLSSIPTHLPPPVQHQHSMGIQPPLSLPNVLQPPPNLQPAIPNLQQPPPIIPVHIPPPSMSQAPASSVVINLNIPPPPLTQMRQMPNIGGQLGFPPLTSSASRAPFLSDPPPQLNARPNLRPPFVPPFTSTGSISNIAHAASNIGSTPSGSERPVDRDLRRGFDVPNIGSTPSGPERPADRDLRRGFDTGSTSAGPERPADRDMRRGFDGNRGNDVDRVERVNLDPARDSLERRDSRGRVNNRGNSRARGNFGRRSFDRGHSDRVRRHRSRSRSGDRDRSRSRSRERRRRRRHSKSRSKSPLSRRWEARNRSRSRSRSPGGKRNRRRSRSRSSSPARRYRRSRSPRTRSSKMSSSPSKSKSPSTPLKSRHLSSSEKQTKQSDNVKEGEDWEVPSPLRSNEGPEEKAIECETPDESATT